MVVELTMLLADFGKTLPFDGKVIKSWFGYTIHLVVDSKYEMPIGFEVTSVSKAKVPVMHKLIDKISEINRKFLAADY